MAIYKNDTFLLDEDASVVEASRIGYGQIESDTASVKRIYLNATSVKMDTGSMVQVPEVPAKDMTASYNTLMPYGDFLGISSAKVTVSGVIDLNSYDEDTGAAPTITYNSTTGVETNAYTITLKFLQLIRKSGHVFMLYDYFNYGWTTGTTMKPDSPVYRLHTLSGVEGSETIAAIPVICTGFSISANTQIEEGGRIDYSINFQEVRIPS